MTDHCQLAALVVDGTYDRHVGAYNFLAALKLGSSSVHLLILYVLRSLRLVRELLVISAIVYVLCVLDVRPREVLLASCPGIGLGYLLLVHLEVAEVSAGALVREDVLLVHDVVAQVLYLYLIATVEVRPVAVLVLAQPELVHMLALGVLRYLLNLNGCCAALIWVSQIAGLLGLLLVE